MHGGEGRFGASKRAAHTEINRGTGEEGGLRLTRNSAVKDQGLRHSRRFMAERVLRGQPDGQLAWRRPSKTRRSGSIWPTHRFRPGSHRWSINVISPTCSTLRDRAVANKLGQVVKDNSRDVSLASVSSKVISSCL